MSNNTAKAQKGEFCKKGIDFLEIGEKISSQLMLKDFDLSTFDDFAEYTGAKLVRDLHYMKIVNSCSIQSIGTLDNVYVGLNEKDEVEVVNIYVVNNTAKHVIETLNSIYGRFDFTGERSMDGMPDPNVGYGWSEADFLIFLRNECDKIDIYISKNKPELNWSIYPELKS